MAAINPSFNPSLLSLSLPMLEVVKHTKEKIKVLNDFQTTLPKREEKLGLEKIQKVDSLVINLIRELTEVTNELIELDRQFEVIKAAYPDNMEEKKNLAHKICEKLNIWFTKISSISFGDIHNELNS